MLFSITSLVLWNRGYEFRAAFRTLKVGMAEKLGSTPWETGRPRRRPEFDDVRLPSRLQRRYESHFRFPPGHTLRDISKKTLAKKTPTTATGHRLSMASQCLGMIGGWEGLGGQK